MKPILVRQALLEKQLKIFSIRDFERVFDLKRYKAKYFLEKEVNNGILKRLRKGLYCLATDLPAEEEVANRMYVPSYISFEYAMAYYNILPETSYMVTNATTKPTRNFNAEGKSFVYYKIKKQAYTGYSLIKKEGREFLMADPEKALVDYLYFVCLGKKVENERLNVSDLKKDKLVGYGRLYGRKKLMNLISKIYDI